MLDAIAKAKPTLLEPIVDIEIVAPDSAIGDITGDLAKQTRSGYRHSQHGRRHDDYFRRCSFGRARRLCAARLNAITQGAGSYSMELSGYAPVPVQKQMELAANFQRKDEDD